MPSLSELASKADSEVDKDPDIVNSEQESVADSRGMKQFIGGDSHPQLKNL